MNISTRLYALVRAYDLFTADAVSQSEYRQQIRDFGEFVKPYEMALNPLFKDCHGLPRPLVQCRYEAAVSIAMDIGLDLFFLTGLPSVLSQGAGYNAISKELGEVPLFNGTLRSSLKAELKAFGIGERPRRCIELDLCRGISLFAVGRKLNSDGEVVYGPFVMHPLWRFMARVR